VSRRVATALRLLGALAVASGWLLLAASPASACSVGYAAEQSPAAGSCSAKCSGSRCGSPRSNAASTSKARQ
jgi:hypothetical protein